MSGSLENDILRRKLSSIEFGGSRRPITRTTGGFGVWSGVRADDDFLGGETFSAGQAIWSGTGGGKKNDETITSVSATRHTHTRRPSKLDAAGAGAQFSVNVS